MAPQRTGLQGVGVVVLFAGVWLIYAAVTNQAPVKTLVKIIQSPADTRNILRARADKISKSPLSKGGTAVDTSGNGGAQAIVAFARAQIGKPYDSPGDSINTFDCSGLTKAAVKAGTGIDIPHGATSQQIPGIGGAVHVSRADLQPGDIIMPSLGHCGVVTGPETMIDAPDYGIPVRERNIYGYISAQRWSAPKGTGKVPADGNSTDRGYGGV